jgi:fucose 4-O-acetylase-like acetyltransferase
MREREHYIDIAKIIGIFLVICGHYVYYLHIPMNENGIYLWNIAITITLFHMPLFYIISGYLYKTPESWITLLKNIINRLLIPYILLCLSSTIIGLFIQLFFNERNIGEAIHELIHNLYGIISGADFPHTRLFFSGPLWFVYSLIIIRIVYYTIERYVNDTLSTKLLVCILCIGGLYLGNNLPFRLDSSIVGLLFFIIGDIGKDMIKKITQLSIYSRIGVIVFSTMILIGCAYYNLDYKNGLGNSINEVAFGPYPLLFFVSGFSGSILILLISSAFKIRCIKCIKILEKLSNANIVILGFHNLVMLSIFYLLGARTEWYIVLGICVITFVFCALLSDFFKKYLPSFVGWR